MTAVLTICETCGFSPEEKTRDGVTGGEALAALVETALGAEAPAGEVTLRRHACLMGCDHPCNVALSSPGKITYVLGGFAATADAAEALADYAAKYAASDKGQVPYKTWPAGVKGHFISRVPPL